MLVISLAKALLLLCCLLALVFFRSRESSTSLLERSNVPVFVFVVLGGFAASFFWTVAPLDDALGSFAKYGKLVAVVALLVLIRSRREATAALYCFVAAQSLLLVSSWLLFLHLPVPWATSAMALTEYAVFSSYLDQGIMTAVLAGICWHLRSQMPGKWGRYMAVGIALVALGNVFFVLNGRSGHLVAIAMLSMAIMWELPKKFRTVVVILPFLLAAGLFFSSDKVRNRLILLEAEVEAYSTQVEPKTSTGLRLNLWRRAAQTIAAHPLAGTGIGSWSTEYNRLQQQQNPAHVAIHGNGNPHQEYLLWGVQLGLPGMALFIALLLAMLRDTSKMDRCHARALQSTLAALAIACLFNSSLYDAQIGDFFCILIGLLLALGLTSCTEGAGGAAVGTAPEAAA